MGETIVATLIEWWVRGVSVLLAIMLCSVAFPAGILGYWGLANLWPQGPEGYLESHLLMVDDWVFTPQRAAAWGSGVLAAVLFAVVGTLWLGWTFRLQNCRGLPLPSREGAGGRI
jgi:hypothetical protein